MDIVEPAYLTMQPTTRAPSPHHSTSSPSAETVSSSMISILLCPPTVRLPTITNSSILQLSWLNVHSLRGSQCLSMTSSALNNVMYSLQLKPGMMMLPVRHCCWPVLPTTTSSNVQDLILLPATRLATNHGGIAVFFSSSFKCRKFDPLDLHTIGSVQSLSCTSCNLQTPVIHTNQPVFSMQRYANVVLAAVMCLSVHSNPNKDCQCLPSLISISLLHIKCSCYSYTEETFPRSCIIKQPVIVFKLREQWVTRLTSSYFSTKDLFPPMQSAYRLRHSTYMALLNITNDVLIAADQGIVIVIILSTNQSINQSLFQAVCP